VFADLESVATLQRQARAGAEAAAADHHRVDLGHHRHPVDAVDLLDLDVEARNVLVWIVEHHRAGRVAADAHRRGVEVAAGVERRPRPGTIEDLDADRHQRPPPAIPASAKITSRSNRRRKKPLPVPTVGGCTLRSRLKLRDSVASTRSIALPSWVALAR